MIADYEISLGRVGDIPGILALHETNLVERGAACRFVRPPIGSGKR
jgi:hypothetical protein